MKQKAEYKSAIRSRRLIKEAFTELMEEKEIDKITVTDIVKKADINRGTFYAHYANIRSLIEQIENDVLMEGMGLLKEFSYKTFIQNPNPILNKVNRLLENEVKLYKKLINNPDSEKFISKLRELFIEYLFYQSDIPDEIKNDKKFVLRINFFAGGMINLYQLWLKEELDYTLDQIREEIIDQTQAMLYLLNLSN